MAQIGSIDAPHMNLRIKLTYPRGYRVRLALLTAVLWVAARVSPSTIDVRLDLKPQD